MASPVIFVLTIIAFEFWIGMFSTSEHSDVVGSWAPWVAAACVLLSSLVVHLTKIVGAWVTRAFTNIRLFVQYDSEERKRLDINHKEPLPVEPLITESLAHMDAHARDIYRHTRWYLDARTRGFIEWWKDPETYSIMERHGYGAFDG